MAVGFDCIQGSKCIRTTHCDKGTKVTYPTSHQHATWSLDDLPRIVACTMHQGSAVTIGSATGEITLWEVGMRYKLVSKPFKIWDMANCYMLLQVPFLPFLSLLLVILAFCDVIYMPMI
ncbi:hypothetical protein ACSBR2_001302 [Camellia fascicularis]